MSQENSNREANSRRSVVIPDRVTAGLQQQNSSQEKTRYLQSSIFNWRVEVEDKIRLENDAIDKIKYEMNELDEALKAKASDINMVKQKVAQKSVDQKIISDNLEFNLQIIMAFGDDCKHLDEALKGFDHLTDASEKNQTKLHAIYKSFLSQWKEQKIICNQRLQRWRKKQRVLEKWEAQLHSKFEEAETNLHMLTANKENAEIKLTELQNEVVQAEEQYEFEKMILEQLIECLNIAGACFKNCKEKANDASSMMMKYGMLIEGNIDIKDNQIATLSVYSRNLSIALKKLLDLVSESKEKYESSLEEKDREEAEEKDLKKKKQEVSAEYQLMNFDQLSSEYDTLLAEKSEQENRSKQIQESHEKITASIDDCKQENRKILDQKEEEVRKATALHDALKEEVEKAKKALAKEEGEIAKLINEVKLVKENVTQETPAAFRQKSVDAPTIHVRKRRIFEDVNEKKRISSTIDLSGDMDTSFEKDDDSFIFSKPTTKKKKVASSDEWF